MNFLTEPPPARRTLLSAAPGVHRIVADNPGRMTYHGTNTYLIEGVDGVIVLDPGPDDATHVADILRLSPGPIVRILVSHTHRDHVGGLAALQSATRALTYGWHRSADVGFVPDVALVDGDEAAGMRVLHTPGHAPDHVCFARDDGVLFSADHVMAWSSSVVSPPQGNMANYFASLHRLLARADSLYLPGHGPPLPEPQRYVRDLLAHRQARELAISAAIASEPRRAAELVDALYPGIDAALRMAAERSIFAHLQKLQGEQRATLHEDLWAAI